MAIADELRSIVRLRGGDVSKVPNVIEDNVRALKKLEQAEVDAGYEAVTPTPSYDAVTPEGTENPSTEGWYERSGEVGSYVYTLSTDTEVDGTKTYYEVSYTENPSTEGWYEKRSNGTYFESEDTEVDLSKTYYEAAT